MSERILKSITSGDDAKRRLKSGIDKLANVVGSTLGYGGRTVLIETPYGLPEPTKDGYKALQSIFLSDDVESMACEVAKQASQRTVDLAGDQTTTTIVLLQAFFNESLKAIANGKSPNDVKREIEQSRDLVLRFLDDLAIDLTDELIYSVALTSANGDEEIAKIVTEAYIKAGENGAVSHLRSETHETYLDYVDGTLVESGIAHELLINNFSDRTCELEDSPLIVCSNIAFKAFRQIQPFLEFALTNNRQIAIIADWSNSQSIDIKDTIVQNVLAKKLKCVLINCPSFGNKRKDLIEDLALLCGTQILSSLSGDDFYGREAQFMGTCKKIVVGKIDTIITPNEDEKIDLARNSKIEELEVIFKNTKSQLEKKYVRDRISKLSGGVSIIKVGAVIESELQEKIDRVDDAVCAVRSAKEEGVIAGGGVALFNSAGLDLDDITTLSVIAPLNKILQNAGVDKTLHLKDYPFGYDVKEFKEVNMIEAGIVDSKKAMKYALINAVAASNTLIMTDNVVTNMRNVYGNE